MESLQTVLALSAAGALLCLALFAGTAIVLAVRHGGRRDEPADDQHALSGSRFTIPVSLIVPVPADAAGTTATIDALLRLNYPEFEVIGVAEDLPAAQWEALKSEWALEAHEYFYRRKLVTGLIRKIYRSSRDARLMIVDKAPGTWADAVNCGVNLARFRYVSAIDVGLAFDANALLRAMSAPLKHPAAVAGASSHVEPADGRERFASVRSQMDSRLAWPNLEAGLPPPDAVAVWRRDTVVHAGGFSTTASSPVLDMAVGLQTVLGSSAKEPRHRVTGAEPTDARFVRTAEIFGRRLTPPPGGTAAEAARRQLAVLQALWSARRIERPALGPLLYLGLTDLLIPLLQAWIVIVTIGAAAAGWTAWWAPVLAVLLLSLGRASVNSAALLIRGSSPEAPDASALRRLVLSSPFDFVASGLPAVPGRMAGAFAFVRSVFTAGQPR